MKSTGLSSRLAVELSGRLGDLVQLLRREVRVGQVSPTGTTVLAALDSDGARRVSELADIAQVSQPTMTTLLRKLHEDGIVTRAADAHDQRVVLIELTDDGRELLTRRRAGRAEALDARLAALDRHDRDALAAAIPALDKLIDNWRKVDPS
jgi:DNA-binding MarR family transcriptional regulator